MVGGGVMDIFVLRVEREKQNMEEGKKLQGEGREGRGPCYSGGPLSRRGCLRFFLIWSVHTVCLTHVRPCISRFFLNLGVMF
jgi:hypothetical protein